MSDEDLLAEQRAYYRRRAPEYDDWWQRRGRYDRGEESAREWDVQVAQVEAALAAFEPGGNVLELAGGTGWWTARLAQTARTLTVIDSSPEVLEANARRVGRDDVDYITADLFAWKPSQRYDTVFFSFWLSHVPPARFAAFWELVGSCLAPGGRVFFIDNRLDPTWTQPDPYVVDEGEGIQRRRLGDGTDHRVVKVYHEPPELMDRLATLGWQAHVEGTRWFVFGSARTSPTGDGR